MARTKLSVYNGVLLYLHQTPIPNLTGNWEARITIDAAWEESLRFVLEEANWNFAQKTETLTYNSSGTPAAGYLYVVNKPTLWYRTVWLKAAATDPHEIDYLDEGAVWFTNYQTVVARWVDSEYIGDGYITAWPASFVKAVVCQIATRVGGHLTGSDAGAEKYDADYKKAVADARNFDAMQQPNIQRRPPGSWRAAMEAGERYSRESLR